MNKKLLTSLVVAIAAFAATPAIAQAEPSQWLSEGKPIPIGESVNVTTLGKLTITVRSATGPIIARFKCVVSDLETVSNTANGGVDEMKEINLTGCTVSPTPCAEGGIPTITGIPPWTSSLGNTEPFIDTWSGVKFEVKCPTGASPGTFTGTLTPEVGKSVLKFTTKRGMLTEPVSGDKMVVAGGDKLIGPPGDKKITAGIV